MEIEKFHNTLIAFDVESETVNATDMLKAYPEKRMADFLKLKQTKAFIDAVLSDNNKSRVTDNEILTIVRGSYSDRRSQGTWMNRLLAYKFAAWLNPEFEVFIYKTFDNVMKEKFRVQQTQLDYFWDKEDQRDLYRRK